MSTARIVQLKDENENPIAPKTSGEGIIMSSGETLNNWIQKPFINEIWHTDGTSSYKMIKFRDGNNYGHGITIGGGGNVIVGSGESGAVLESEWTGDAEVLILSSDNEVVLKSGVQSGKDNANTLTYDNNGSLIGKSIVGSWVDTFKYPLFANNAPAISGAAVCGLTLRTQNYRYGLFGYQDNFFINSITNTNFDNGTNTCYKQWQFLNNGGLTMSGACTASSHPTSSSKRYKENIKDITEEQANKILELRPVNYDYIDKSYGTDCDGMIAEEVAEVLPHLVIYNEEGQPEALDYSRFVPSLIKLCQTQQKEIDELKEKINNLLDKEE